MKKKNIYFLVTIILFSVIKIDKVIAIIANPDIDSSSGAVVSCGVGNNACWINDNAPILKISIINNDGNQVPGTTSNLYNTGCALPSMTEWVDANNWYNNNTKILGNGSFGCNEVSKNPDGFVNSIKNELQNNNTLISLISDLTGKNGNEALYYINENNGYAFKIEFVFIFEEILDNKIQILTGKDAARRYFTTDNKYWSIDNVRGKMGRGIAKNILFLTYLPNSSHGITGVNVTEITKSDWEILNEAKKENTGYSIGLVTFNTLPQTPRPKCDYNNPDHFSANRTNGPDASSGPNGENCCQYFKDNPAGGTLWRDHPECYSPRQLKPSFTEATCELGKNQAEYKDVSDINSSWQDIYATIYRGDDNTGISNRRFVKAEYSGGSLLCYEQIKINLPEKYIDPIRYTGSFIWPNTANGKYNLIIKSNVQCKIYISTNATKSAIEIKNHFLDYIRDNYNLEGNFTIDYNSKPNSGNDYKVNNIKLIKYKTKKYDYDNATEIYNATSDSDIKNLTIRFSQEAYYRLADYYKYISTDSDGNNIYSNTSKSSNFIKLEYGVIPNSFTTNSSDNVTIHYSTIGGFSKKPTIGNKSYTCPYEVNGGGKSLYCPKGTINENVKLDYYLEQCPQLTYEDLKLKFCPSEGTDIKCSDLFTDADHPDNVIGKRITVPSEIKNSCYWFYKSSVSYVDAYYNYGPDNYCYDNNLPICPYGTTRAGATTKLDGSPMDNNCISDSDCVNRECNNSDDDYCPEGTYYEGASLDNFRDKINYFRKYESLSQSEAIKKACNLKEKIIYRTISLDNPFPGKDGSGRNPGINWASEYYVKDGKLLGRNQSVSGNALYTTKEPMYVIYLTPSTIKEIRNYNSENEYDDFNLDCKSDNNGKCISKFLHNLNGESTAQVTLSGTCASATTALLFDSCAN